MQKLYKLLVLQLKTNLNLKQFKMSKLRFEIKRIGEEIEPINQAELAEYKLQVTNYFSQEQIDELSSRNGYVLISIGADGKPIEYMVIG
jgi:hypothetical protein